MVELGTAGSRRRVVGATAGVLCVVAATADAAAVSRRGDVGDPGLILVLPCVVAAVMGGRTAGLVVALVAAGAFNLVFLEPYGTFKVDSVDDVVAFVVLALVALIVATLVAREGERRRAAMQRTAEAESLWRANAADAGRAGAARGREAGARSGRRAARRHCCDRSRTTCARRSRRSGRSCRISATASRTTSTRDELLELVADEAERLDRLVQNLLVDEPDRGGRRCSRTRQAVPIDELLDDRVRRLAQLLRDTTVDRRRPADLPLVSADYTLVEQVVTNLLENASRHSPPARRDRR